MIFLESDASRVCALKIGCVQTITVFTTVLSCYCVFVLCDPMRLFLPSTVTSIAVCAVLFLCANNVCHILDITGCVLAQCILSNIFLGCLFMLLRILWANINLYDYIAAWLCVFLLGTLLCESNLQRWQYFSTVNHTRDKNDSVQIQQLALVYII